MALGDAGIRKAAAAGMIPEAVLGKITDDELRDRFAYAAQLTAQANRTGGREGARLIAKAREAMVAQPRAVTEREVKALVAKASAAGNGHQADVLRQRANALLEEHPPAPRHPAAPAASGDRRNDAASAVLKSLVRKAPKGSAAPLVPVYDGNGKLLGVVDPDSLTLVKDPTPKGSSAPAPPPAQPAGQDEVAKARKRSVRPPRAEVLLDAAGQMRGVVRNGRYTAVPQQVIATSRDRERATVAKASAAEWRRDLAAAAADPEFGRAVMTALPAERREVVAAWKASHRSRR